MRVTTVYARSGCVHEAKYNKDPTMRWYVQVSVSGSEYTGKAMLGTDWSWK